MGHRFDEFAKSLARGTSRREALRQLGFGLAGLGLAALGLSKPAYAAKHGGEGQCECSLTSTCTGTTYTGSGDCTKAAIDAYQDCVFAEPAACCNGTETCAP